jgi:hypothetical protein
MSIACSCGCNRIGEAWKFTDRGPILRGCAIRATSVVITYIINGQAFIETLKAHSSVNEANTATARSCAPLG